MGRKNCLIKISGDEIDNDKVLAWLKKLSLKYFVAVCIGGGTQINKAFKEAGLPVRKFGPLGRATPTFEERLLAHNILAKNQSEVQDCLADLGIYVAVEIPVRYIATVLCHENGDQYVLSAYHGYDLIWVVTKPERIKEKAIFFKPYKKIKVIGF